MEADSEAEALRKRKNCEKSRRYYLKHKNEPLFKERLNRYYRESFLKHREKRLFRNNNVTEEVRAKRREEGAKFRERHRARLREKNRAWKKTHPEAWSNWASKNRDRLREYTKKRSARLRIESANFKLAHSLRSRIGQAVKGRIKAGSAVKALGCTIDEFRFYIERSFQEGMSWSNWGRKGWHLDHIKPLAAFDLSDPEQFNIAAHFSNYQPLWALDNARKGAKITTD